MKRLLPIVIAISQAGSETFFDDVTSSHVPRAPDLHALDAEFVDVDKDGDLDVVIAVEHGTNRLYLNDGRGKLKWEKGAFGKIPYDSEHVVSADFNRDGYPDIVFVAEDDGVHQFFIGGARGKFKDVSSRLPTRSKANALAVGDVNGDGLPDIVIGNAGQDFLWVNDPQRPGHFIDATATHLPVDADSSQDIALADVDGDRDLDMVIVNETPPNRLLLNGGVGRFTDVSTRLQLVVPMETRQVHVLDANQDGRPDLLFLNLTSNNGGWEKDPQARLLVNDGKGQFKDLTRDRLPAHRSSTYGGAIVDFNGDGAPDILIGPVKIPGFEPLQVRAWQNDGKGNFKDVTTDVIPDSTVGRHWGMAVGDLNGDGRDDIFIGGLGTQARLLLSRGGADTNLTK